MAFLLFFRSMKNGQLMPIFITEAFVRFPITITFFFVARCFFFEVWKAIITGGGMKEKQLWCTLFVSYLGSINFIKWNGLRRFLIVSSVPIQWSSLYFSLFQNKNNNKIQLPISYKTRTNLPLCALRNNHHLIIMCEYETFP